MNALRVLFVFVFAAAATARADARPKLAVLELQHLVGVTPELAQGVSAALVSAVRQRATDYSVIGADELRALLDHERQNQQLGCAQSSCLAEIGGALGAQSMVSGSLGKFGSTYLLTVKLFDVRHASVTREIPATLKGLEDDALLGAVKVVVAQLFPNGSGGGGGELNLTAKDLWEGKGPPSVRSRAALGLPELQALLDQKAYPELIEHLEDVPPSARDAAWEKITAAGAVGLVAAQGKDDPFGAFGTSRGLAERFPSLLKSPDFVRARAELAVRGFRACDEARGLNGSCTADLVEAVRSQPDLALRGGEEVSLQRSSKWSALPLYAIAVTRAGDPGCKDQRLRDSVVSALDLSSQNPRVADAARLADQCFDDLKDALLDELASSGGEYFVNACPVLVKHGGLSRLQAAKCKR